ncbi:DNA-binding FadR family transcriptional regulator [Mycetocola sp. BIGb0189]|uniref:FadR/GntR family transcriptional regulator n=1 Tax=Mycetocola sp. BIGb0189 TaxID=2940604 RepID=UPI00216828F8|nr:FCD domain-containing protein [Mycetocola sp. BIGb0189]MCS4276399.1 DNA-binding FadR family transcriptional regulator [Mycetocola sp. BIGb0189]
MSSSLHDRAVEELGRRIISGELPAGSAVLATDLANELGVSRSVIREAVRVLQSLGLVESVRRLGIRVLAEDHWRVLDPQLIAWRLSGTGRGAQLRSLTELRRSVEPAAAELAARHAPDAVAERLLQIAARMRSIGRAGDLESFQDLDIQFHALVLGASGNEMFAAMSGMIGAVLRGRTRLGLMPKHPHEDALQLHIDVAVAIQGRDPERARAAMDAIMSRTLAEVEHIWAEEPRTARTPLPGTLG